MTDRLLHQAIDLLSVLWAPLTALCFAGYIIRQRYFHPLSKFHGPFLASLTNFWRLFDYLTHKQHLNDLARHKHYGPVFRDGPNSLSFSDPRALDVIYSSKNEFHKSEWYYAFPPTTTDADVNHFMARHVEQARYMKKRVMPLYSMSNALEYEGRIGRPILEWIEKLEELHRADIAEWCHYLSLDIISDIFYGKSTGFIQAGHDLNGHIKSMKGMFRVMTFMTSVPTLTKIMKGPLFGWLLKPSPDATHGYGRSYAYAQNLVDERLENKISTEKPHFAQYIVSQVGKSDLSKGEKPMTKDVAVGECMVGIMAGSDSVAAALVAILALIGINNDTYARLRKEIDEADQKGQLSTPIVGYNETLELPFLHAVIKESMRLYPSFGSTWPRILPPSGTNVLPETFVPGGVDVGVTAYVSNRNKEIFGEDAELFRPERWISSSTEKLRIMDRYHYVFGYKYSARVCSGQHLAMVELAKTIVELFRRVDFRLAKPPQNDFEGRNNIQMFYEEVEMVFERRQRQT